jgi:transposase
MLPASVRILVCTAPQDMRKGFDTLAAVVREVLREEPQSGALYVFVGRRPTRVKILWLDKNGCCLLYKRLHRALFVLPESANGAALVTIDSAALEQLLLGVGKEERRHFSLVRERRMVN